MNKVANWFVMLAFGTIFYGCAVTSIEQEVTPIKQEVSLPPQVVGQPPSSPSNTRLVIFNDSNPRLYGIDGSGKINISVDGKGVGQLNVGQFVVIETAQGGHVVDLTHKDFLEFRSTHNIGLSKPESFLKIYSKPTSNGAEVVEKPQGFGGKYASAYGDKPGAHEIESLANQFKDRSKYEDKMKEFVEIAAKGNADSILELVAPTARQRNEENIKKEIRQRTIPFFAEYQRLHNVVRVNPASDDLGNRGLAFYTYIVTKSAAVKPFAIAIVEQQGKLFVVNYETGRCMPDRHPFCP